MLEALCSYVASALHECLLRCGKRNSWNEWFVLKSNGAINALFTFLSTLLPPVMIVHFIHVNKSNSNLRLRCDCHIVLGSDFSIGEGDFQRCGVRSHSFNQRKLFDASKYINLNSNAHSVCIMENLFLDGNQYMDDVFECLWFSMLWLFRVISTRI